MLQSCAVLKETGETNFSAIAEAVKAVTKALKSGGKIMLLGNGGSAADSQHIAAEFIGRFQLERRSLPAIALTTDTSIITALANDYGVHKIFSRQVEGLARRGDVLMAFSTSGNSENVIGAVRLAGKKGVTTISFTGNGGGKLAPLTDIAIIVPSRVTARIQEAHICAAHCLCELVEAAFKSSD